MGQTQSCKKQMSSGYSKECANPLMSSEGRMKCHERLRARYDECVAKDLKKEEELLEKEAKQFDKIWNQGAGKNNKKPSKTTKKVKKTKPSKK